MSYYIGVFDFKNRMSKEEIINWFKEKSEWNEERDYNSIEGTSEKLINFFMDIKEKFPPMNGNFAPEDSDLTEEMERYLVDYTICDNLIYMCSAWSVAEEFDNAVKTIAKKYGLSVLEFTYDDYIITHNMKYFNSLKEIYDELKGKVVGNLIYKNEDTEYLNWNIDELNNVYIDSDYFNVSAHVKRKKFITGKEKIINLNVPHWHPDSNFDEIYDEIKCINDYYKKYGSLEKYQNNN